VARPRWRVPDVRLAGVGVVLVAAWVGIGVRLVDVQALSADQYAGREGVAVEFFGRSVSTPRGPAALAQSQEGAEDQLDDGAHQMDARNIDASDLVIGIAASGTTPWVRSALARAKARGATTAIVACSPPPPDTLEVTDFQIVVLVGPEAITGSTRLKAGTATKLVLNAITTGAMVRLGKTHGNLMVDLLATNDKLRDRSERIVMEVTGLAREAARELIEHAGGRVKTALVMHTLGVDAADAERRLADAGGVIRRLAPAPPAP